MDREINSLNHKHIKNDEGQNLLHYDTSFQSNFYYECKKISLDLEKPLKVETSFFSEFQKSMNQESLIHKSTKRENLPY